MPLNLWIDNLSLFLRLWPLVDSSRRSPQRPRLKNDQSAVLGSNSGVSSSQQTINIARYKQLILFGMVVPSKLTEQISNLGIGRSLWRLPDAGSIENTTA